MHADPRATKMCAAAAILGVTALFVIIILQKNTIKIYRTIVIKNYYAYRYVL